MSDIEFRGFVIKLENDLSGYDDYLIEYGQCVNVLIDSGDYSYTVTGKVVGFFNNGLDLPFSEDFFNIVILADGSRIFHNCPLHWIKAISFID